MQSIQCFNHSGVEIHMIVIMCLANLSLTQQLISTANDVVSLLAYGVHLMLEHL
jgi:hypothetical protein